MDWVKKNSFILIIILLFLSITNVYAININSKYAVLYNLNEDTLLYQKNKDERTSIASLTKIMTTLVAIENIDNYQKEITINNQMLLSIQDSGAYVMGLKPGMKVTYDDLLYGMFLTSGADATMVVAISTAGTEKEFVKLMNDKAKELKLKNTNFVNPIGLDDDNHYSTVDEVATVLKEALKNKKFKKIFTTKEYTFKSYPITIQNSLHKKALNYNMNDDFIIGSKTGYTDNASYSLATVAKDKINNINYMLITTNADSAKNYLNDATTIYKYYFENYKYQKLVKRNDLILTLSTKYSSKSKVEFYADKDIKYYLNNNYSKKDIKLKYIGEKILTPKMKKNKRIGKIYVKYKDKDIDTIDIIVKEKIPYSIMGFVKYHIIYFIAIIIILYLFYKKVRKNNYHIK